MGSGPCGTYKTAPGDQPCSLETIIRFLHSMKFTLSSLAVLGVALTRATAQVPIGGQCKHVARPSPRYSTLIRPSCYRWWKRLGWIQVCSRKLCSIEASLTRPGRLVNSVRMGATVLWSRTVGSFHHFIILSSLTDLIFLDCEFSPSTAPVLSNQRCLSSL